MTGEMTWRMVLFGGLLAAVGSAAPACSDDGSTGPPPGPFGADCERNGEPCPVLCDAVLGCVECLSDADCPAANPACVAGSCEECGESADCPTGEACFPRDHQCEAACADENDCTSNDEPQCDLATGACVGCLASADCELPEPVCSPVTQQCAECASSDDCGAAEPVCDVADGQCRQCVVDGDCPAAEPLCHDHRCEEGCTSDDDCGDARPVCNLDSHRCVECLTATNCTSAAPLCDARNRCVACVTDDDCVDPELGVCAERGECVECEVPGDCPQGSTCRDEQCSPTGSG